ncbi:N-acetyl sugar amidotransferase [Gammaproteobacteria bacterium]|nr:N-acetyl sugar amidotransferase [Gammaproteobacteria bacterium]
MDNSTRTECQNCIMDSSDPNIIFDADGVCDYCNNFKSKILPNWKSLIKDDKALMNIRDQIKSTRSNPDFDCVIGLSGGLDSSYVAYVTKEIMGLRPLLFHVDAGWNTDQAVGNIEKLVDGLGLNLYTSVVNWNDIKRMQVAFLKSGIPDQDLVQDAAFFSELYKFARKNNIKHVITGSNFSTECCREPEEWGGYLGIDKTLFNDIWRLHGDGKPNEFPVVDILLYKLFYQKILGMKVHHPLNCIEFNKRDAETKLRDLFGWEAFKHKHHESRFTRFYEDYWLPKRFGFHKRRAHFSSLILTNQMTRDEAIKRISSSEMGDHFLANEFDFVADKLSLSRSELEAFLHLPIKTFQDYRNKRFIISFGTKIFRLLGIEKRFFR